MVDKLSMHEGGVTIRRGRRTDFPALLALLSLAEQPETAKAQVRHWRRLASDPGHDFYVAEYQGLIQGMVLVSYIRGLKNSAWQAVLDMIVPSAVAGSVGQELLDFAKRRARQRGCQYLLTWYPSGSLREPPPLLIQGGFSPAGEMLSCNL
jgi:N-acetylglutamate synthase-like GNAT family acetyltransferase